MRRIIYGLLFIIFLFSPQGIFAEEGWVIEKFHSNIALEANGTVKIVENINVDFDNLSKHGIYRFIPYIYKDSDGGKSYTKVEVLSVIQNGSSAKYQSYEDGDNIQIKIGDPNKTISGKNNYVISYVVAGVLLSFSDYDEFYWNITGNYWEVPIHIASAKVNLPSPSIEQISCYRGAYGSESECEEKNQDTASASFSASNLNLGEGLTVAVGYTKGLVPIVKVERPKTFAERMLESDSIISFFISFIGGALTILLLWYKKGRDFWSAVPGILNSGLNSVHIKPIGAKESIVVEYEPPENLQPAIVGVLMDERADTLDVTATIIDLATRGFLTITEISKKWIFGSRDFEFAKKDKDKKELLSYERLLLTYLFQSGDTVRMSALKNTFYDELAKVKKALYEDVSRLKLFVENPESVRGLYLIIAIVILVGAAFALFNGIGQKIPVLTSAGAGFVLSGLTLLVVSNFMPRRTAVGREMYRRMKGYRLFISGAEKYKQQFFEKKNMFNIILPYAIIFGLTEKFAQAMRELGIKPETTGWYYGTSHFNVVSFGTSLNSFSSSMSSAIASSPSSSGSGGGGFSGGGGGGGGGGSW